MRFSYLPQFIDAYYHLSVANAFIESGGWVGWDWWSFAPAGRPHMYPPVYHFILVCLQKIGLSGINSLRITEVSIIPLFFFSLWYVSRRIINSKFAFFALLALSGFFSFYVSVSANIPASLAIIFGLFSWMLIKKNNIFISGLLLALSFYTHAGMPWIFLCSFLTLSMVNKEYRSSALKVIFLGICLALPFFWHCFKYLDWVNTSQVIGAKFIVVNIFIIVFGIVGLFCLCTKNNFLYALCVGYTAGSVFIFFKYPYRLFSGQGVIGLALIAVLLFLKISDALIKKNIKYSFYLCVFFIGYLSIFNSTLSFKENQRELCVDDSTYYNFLTGASADTISYNSLFFPEYYSPIIDVIGKNTQQMDIISSNSNFIAQIFSAVTGRPSSSSVFREVATEDCVSRYAKSKVVILLNDYFHKKNIMWKEKGWKLLYHNDFAHIFLNSTCLSTANPVNSKFKFSYTKYLFLFFFFLFVIWKVEQRIRRNRRNSP